MLFQEREFLATDHSFSARLVSDFAFSGSAFLRFLLARGFPFYRASFSLVDSSCFLGFAGRLSSKWREMIFAAFNLNSSCFEAFETPPSVRRPFLYQVFFSSTSGFVCLGDQACVIGV